MKKIFEMGLGKSLLLAVAGFTIGNAILFCIVYFFFLSGPSTQSPVDVSGVPPRISQRTDGVLNVKVKLEYPFSKEVKLQQPLYVWAFLTSTSKVVTSVNDRFAGQPVYLGEYKGGSADFFFGLDMKVISYLQNNSDRLYLDPAYASTFKIGFGAIGAELHKSFLEGNMVSDLSDLRVPLGVEIHQPFGTLKDGDTVDLGKVYFRQHYKYEPKFSCESSGKKVRVNIKGYGNILDQEGLAKGKDLYLVRVPDHVRSSLQEPFVVFAKNTGDFSKLRNFWGPLAVKEGKISTEVNAVATGGVFGSFSEYFLLMCNAGTPSGECMQAFDSGHIVNRTFMKSGVFYPLVQAHLDQVRCDQTDVNLMAYPYKENFVTAHMYFAQEKEPSLPKEIIDSVK